ncbi:MAG: DUF4332 domain-containing protein [Anaerolineae bacterium]|nr:DUF4332 domain-containing protein [Anaerolineae bacterium]
MGYYIDLSTISLDILKQKLQSADLIPSQQILLDQIDERFAAIHAQGIHDLDALQQALKTKQKVERFAGVTSLPVDYLTVLRREVNSYHPQARPIADFPNLPDEIKQKLESTGIKTTIHLFDRVAAKDARNELTQQLDLTDDEALLLARLADLSRLRYVSPVFAVWIIDAGYPSIESIRAAAPEALCAALASANADNRYYRGSLSLRDARYLVDDAGYVPLDVEY